MGAAHSSLEHNGLHVARQKDPDGDGSHDTGFARSRAIVELHGRKRLGVDGLRRRGVSSTGRGLLCCVLVTVGLVGVILSGSVRVGASHVGGGRATKVTEEVDWPRFGDTADQHRYAAARQINAGTVGRLGVAWTLTEDPRVPLWETDPVVVNGVMYLTSSTDEVFALRADSGKVLWRYTPTVDFVQFALAGEVTPINRGVEVADGAVFVATLDDHLIALDARTGARRWSARVADPAQGYQGVAPPTYWRGLLFVGSAGGDSGARGFVAAYDAHSGRQVWRYDTVPRRGVGWLPAAGAHGGGDVWMPVTIDERRGLVVFGAGNPSPDLIGVVRPGCDPWTDAVVALRARTGAFVWGRTLVCPDRWDYDVDQTPMLLPSPSHTGAGVVGEATKNGYYWLLDGATGRTLARSPALTRQVSPRPGSTVTGGLVCPGKIGGLEYSPPAFSPRTGALYLPGIDQCMTYKPATPHTVGGHRPGQPDLGGEIVATGVKPRGFMAALRADGLTLLWRTPMPAPLIGGALATAGDLVFSGSDDGRFYAFDARTGVVRWSARIGLGFGAAPITYVVHGTQYIAIAAGGSGVTAYTGGRVGGRLVVFKLGGKALPR